MFWVVHKLTLGQEQQQQLKNQLQPPVPGAAHSLHSICLTEWHIF